MHAAFVERLLDHEIGQAREQKWFAERVSSIERNGLDIIVQPIRLDPELAFRFYGRRYDAEPLGFAVTHSDGEIAEIPAWPPGLCHGEHPWLKRPFACVRGLFEYHTHFSHLEPWDRCRYDLRFPLVLQHVLTKAQL